jgi:hypothetical protein
MCISQAALADAGGFGDSLVEDQELGVRLFLSGHKVQWLHDVRISDEKPSRAVVAIRQRSRWVSGRRHVAATYLGRLLRRGEPASWDLALRLIQPSRIVDLGWRGSDSTARSDPIPGQGSSRSKVPGSIPISGAVAVDQVTGPLSPEPWLVSHTPRRSLAGFTSGVGVSS